MSSNNNNKQKTKNKKQKKNINKICNVPLINIEQWHFYHHVHVLYDPVPSDVSTLCFQKSRTRVFHETVNICKSSDEYINIFDGRDENNHFWKHSRISAGASTKILISNWFLNSGSEKINIPSTKRTGFGSTNSVEAILECVCCCLFVCCLLL